MTYYVKNSSDFHSTRTRTRTRLKSHPLTGQNRLKFHYNKDIVRMEIRIGEMLSCQVACSSQNKRLQFQFQEIFSV